MRRRATYRPIRQSPGQWAADILSALGMSVLISLPIIGIMLL